MAVDVPNAQIQFAVEPGWQDPSAFNSRTGPPGFSVGQAIAYIFRNGRPVLGRLFTQTPFTGDRFTVANSTPPVLPAVRPGDTAVIGFPSGAVAVAINHCNGCTLRNVTVFAAPGAGVQGLDAQSSVFERVYSIPKPGTDRLVSTWGIAFFPINRPNNLMRLVRAISGMDGGLALIAEYVGTVASQIDSRRLAVRGGDGPTVIGDGDSVPNGSSVVFQRPSDGVFLGSASIVSQTPPSGSPPQVVFTFDRDLPGGLPGTVMESTDPSCQWRQHGPRTQYRAALELLHGCRYRRPRQQHASWQLYPAFGVCQFFSVQSTNPSGVPPLRP